MLKFGIYIALNGVTFSGAALSLFQTFVIKYFGIISSFLSNIFGEKRFVNSGKVFPANIKSKNLIQKYPHIIESYACILKIFAFMFLLPINVIISFGICSIPKEPK